MTSAPDAAPPAPPEDAAEDVLDLHDLDLPGAPTEGAPLVEGAVRGAVTRRRPATPVSPELMALWQQYKAHGAVGDRDALILHYARLVKYVANRVATTLPPTIEHGDLVSYGTFGLIDAIERFELDRGLKFETYAVTRIRGAIIDELRSVDWVPRSVRTKARDVERASATLLAELGRTPTEAEVAGRLHLTVPELRAVATQVASAYVVPLDELMHRGGDGDDAAVTLGDRLTDDRIEAPGDSLEAEQTRRALNAAIADLSDRDRVVISLYYFEGLTLAEIGQVLGVTESRVCQLHTRATASLRPAMTDWDAPV